MSSPEFDLLCSAIRPRPDHSRIGALIAGDVDWRHVAHLATIHGVRPQLLHGLPASVRKDIPGEIRVQFDAFQRGHLRRSVQAASQLLDIAQSLTSAAIPFATFKGPALAIALYGDISRREFNDIDIVVRRDDAASAEQCLRSLGYRARHGSAEFRRTFLAYHRQYMYERPDSDLAVDLHWDFAAKGVPFPLRAHDIWQDLESVALGGREIPVLGRTALAVFLAGHGTKEGWRSLGWIGDMADFIGHFPGLDWQAIYNCAAERDCGRSILLGQLLAHRLLGTGMEPGLLARADRDRKLQAMANAIAGRMALHSSRPNEDHASSFGICETWRDKVRLAWVLATTRTTGDYEAMPLPRPLWRLYHLTRPFRLLKTLLAREPS